MSGEVTPMIDCRVLNEVLQEVSRQKEALICGDICEERSFADLADLVQMAEIDKFRKENLIKAAGALLLKLEEE